MNGRIRTKMVQHRNCIEFITSRFGDQGWKNVLNCLDAKDRDVALLESKVINKWVDLDTHVRLLSAIVNELNHGKEDILLETGEWTATRDLQGIYSIFLIVFSIEFMLKRSSIIFSTFYDEGGMEVKTLAPGKVECIFKGFTKQQRLIELTITGWFAGAAKLSRAKDIKLDIITSLKEDKGFFRLLFTYNT
jgi:hypothetical protein